jgi:ribosomal protein S18 acetylase RimI-like enzyme
MPAGYSWRRPELADAAAITALVLTHDEQFLAAPDVTLGQIEALLQERTVDLGSRAWLVFDAVGELRAAALVYVDAVTDEAEIDIYPHPDVADGVIAWLIQEGLAAVVAQRRASGLRLPITAGLHQGDARSISHYEAAGLRRVRMFWRMGMSLPKELPAVSLPDGYRMRRAVQVEADLRAFHAATEAGFADHWRSHPRSYEVWLADLEGVAGHDPALWWVVETGSGGYAATMIGGHRMAELDSGFVYTLATLPQHRGRGLAKALLHRAMQDAAEAGYGQLQLTVDAANPTGAVRLYESVGMRSLAAFSIYGDG